MRSIAAVALLLAGCSQPEPKQTTTPAGETVPTTTTGTPGGTVSTTPYTPDCGDVVTATWPEDGRQNVYYRTDIEYVMSSIVGDEVLVVREAGGEIPGTMSYAADRITFQPDAPLAPNTAYTVALESCPPSATAWLTSSAGAPVDSANLVGTNYVVNIDSGRWIEPAGAGALLGGNLTVDILIGVSDATPTTLSVLGGVTEELSANQDLCSETVAFPDASFASNPYFEIGPQDITIGILGSNLDIDDLHLSGAFRTDFSGIEGATMEGQMDTRGLVELLAPGQGDDAVCVILNTFGVACVTCNAGGDFCVDVVVEDLAVPATASVVVPRTAYDIANDPGCP